jgi:hypothetical protein
MPIRVARGPKAEIDSKVFTAFLGTQAWKMGYANWDCRVGLPIDFVWREGGIGVELGEWLDPEQGLWVAERDRLRGQIESEIGKRRLVRFQAGGRDPRCTVEGYVERLPSRIDKKRVVDELIRFMVDFERDHTSEIYQPHGYISAPRSQLPESLSTYFARLSFIRFVHEGNLGVPLTKPFDIGQPVQSDSALRSLRETTSKKVVEKAETYRTEKERLGLSELWLVVHYSSPDVFNAPMFELNMEVGYGEHRRISQDNVASMAKVVLHELGGRGPFDRVFFLIDCQPNPYVSEISGYSN